VVEFANRNCWICFEPDVDTDQSNLAIQDVLDPILYTLNHQKSRKGVDITITKMVPFIKAVTRGDYGLPKSVKDLAVKEK
jgi:hypothetical protein